MQISYLIVVFGLFLYSFTQVDLNLTLSQWSVWQVVEKFFQHIGYFQRPFSTFFYIAIVLLLYLFYFLFLRRARVGGIRGIRGIWVMIITMTVILAFSYNAFSYDLFNYIFDAKIVTHYHQNPYLHKALDYASDPMLSFMHWTHRTYPYGPVWLLLTIPISFIGFDFFLLTFFMFKFLIAASFIGTAFFIGKILNKIYPQNETFGLVFFAFNPLIIIESLVSGHNDIVMIFFAVLSIYLILNKNYFRSFILLIMSIGVKFATFFLLPIFGYIYLFGKNNQQINWQRIFDIIVILMIIPIIIATVRTNFQPWYLLYVIPFASLVSKKYYIFIPTVIISFFSLLQYVPFLYLGNWNPPVPAILTWIMNTSVLVSGVLVLAWKVIKYKT